MPPKLSSDLHRTHSHIQIQNESTYHKEATLSTSSKLHMFVPIRSLMEDAYPSHFPLSTMRIDSPLLFSSVHLPTQLINKFLKVMEEGQGIWSSA